jgi:ligand-binding SRPBCC domain-containing protein
MRFEHRFHVDAPREAVAAFHATAHGLRAITPTPMCIHHAPDVLESGDEVRFTLWLGPIPVRWHGRVENLSVEGFDDVQLAGPFGAWRHRHNFEEAADGGTEVHDVVTASMPGLLSLRYPLAAIMWIGLPLLFTFRARRTRRLVAGFTNVA